MSDIKITDTTMYWEEFGTTRTLIHCWLGV